MVRLINEADHRYGRLVVIDYIAKDKHGWCCQCDCGNQVVVVGSDLRRGHTQSCGCLQRDRSSEALTKDMTGWVFGQLTAVCRERGTHRVSWRCRCECGNELVVNANSLRQGLTRSCGCLRRLPRGEAAFNSLIGSRKREARGRRHKWELTKDQFRVLTQRPCCYCGSPPGQVSRGPDLNGEYIYNGLDRVDNSRAYSIDNVVPCCGSCNWAKQKMTVEQFREWVCRIYKHFVLTKIT